MGDAPKQAGTAPIKTSVAEGKTYFWCACGLSKTQPFCDGSHKQTDITPQAWKAEKDEEVWFCTCKQTSRSPLCDGTHKRLA